MVNIITKNFLLAFSRKEAAHHCFVRDNLMFINNQ
jgi:hypothetical protein